MSARSPLGFRSRSLVVVLLALLVGGCREHVTRSEDWAHPDIIPLDYAVWRGADPNDLTKPSNVRNRMVNLVSFQPWKGKTLLHVIESLGNPDFTVRKEDLEGRFGPKFGPTARLAIGYRYAVAGDGLTLCLFFVVAENGRVLRVEKG